MLQVNELVSWTNNCPLIRPNGDPDFGSWLDGAPLVTLDEGSQPNINRRRGTDF